MMRKLTVSFLLACLFLSCLGAGSNRFGVVNGAQEPSDEQWQLPKSRDFGDSIWKEKRKPSRQQPKRRKYQRVEVASSSAIALKYRKPATSGGASASVKRRKPASPVKPALVWQDVALASSEQVGVTMWRLRKCRGGKKQRCLELNDAQGHTFMYEAVRVTTDAGFQGGDGIQLAIESPIAGFIYVIHQEVYKNDKTGAPKLLYPLYEGGNAVAPGRPLLIPTQVAGEGIKVLKMRNEQGKDLVAERLKIIVARRPLDGIFVQDRPRFIGDADVRLWESQWSGRLELFDLEGGGKETMSLNEWSAMQRGNGVSRDLTTADLAPQKLYLVERKRSDGVLITLDLPYGN